MRPVVAIAVTAALFAGAGAIGCDSASADAPAPQRAPHPAPWKSRPSPDHKLEYHGTAMGTSVSLYFWTDDETEAAKGFEAVMAEMKRIDRMMTTWLPDSEVSQINANAGIKPIKVSDETFAVITRAQDVSRRTRGIFDITVGAFRGLWKFDQDMDGTLPDQKEVKKRLKLVGYRNLILNKAKHTVYLRKKGMRITLGGIAKGYAVDKCVEILRARGFVDFMVQAGGDMYIAGSKGSRPWVVGIRDPRGPASATFASMAISDHSFSTSGDYERGFVRDGIRYHHILDPRTGEPARMSRSVTVKAHDAFTADAWSKVMFILGWKEATRVIKREKLKDFEVVWVDHDNNVHISDGLKSSLVIQHPPTPGP